MLTLLSHAATNLFRIGAKEGLAQQLPFQPMKDCLCVGIRSLAGAKAISSSSLAADMSNLPVCTWAAYG